MAKDYSKHILGIVITMVGIVLLLNNFNITQINIIALWPLLLILWGLNSLFTGSKSFVAKSISILITILGALLLVSNLELMTINIQAVIRLFFPLLFIILGISLLLGKPTSGTSNWAVMGGVDKGKKESWTLEDSSYVAIMGGIELDLTNATIPAGETFLDLTAVMGGIDIKVPGDLTVVCDGFALLGGLEMFDRDGGGIITSATAEQKGETGDRAVRIQGRAIMGGISIKRAS